MYGKINFNSPMTNIFGIVISVILIVKGQPPGIQPGGAPGPWGGGTSLVILNE